MPHANASATTTADGAGPGLRGEGTADRLVGPAGCHRSRQRLRQAGRPEGSLRRWPDPRLGRAFLAGQACRGHRHSSTDHVPDAAPAGGRRAMTTAGTQAVLGMAGDPRQPAAGRDRPLPCPPRSSGGSRCGSGWRPALQVPVRLLIQTGRRIEDPTQDDLEEFAAACHERTCRTGTSYNHHRRRSATPTGSCSISASWTVARSVGRPRWRSGSPTCHHRSGRSWSPTWNARRRPARSEDRLGAMATRLKHWRRSWPRWIPP